MLYPIDPRPHQSVEKRGQVRISVQYGARKQAADSPIGRLLTRAVLYRRPNVVYPDLADTRRDENTFAFLPN